MAVIPLKAGQVLAFLLLSYGLRSVGARPAKAPSTSTSSGPEGTSLSVLVADDMH